MAGQGWRIGILVRAAVLAAVVSGCGGDPVEPEEMVVVAVFSAGAGSGTVTITPSTTTCTIVDGAAGDTCGAAVAVGANVVLKAVPAAGHSFAGWGDDCVAATTDTCSLRADLPLSVSVTFTPVAQLPVEEVRLDRTSLRLGLGQSASLAARVFGPGGVELVGRPVTWSTDAPNVVNILDGNIAPGLPGTAIVTAASGGKTATMTVEVPARVMHDLAEVNGMALPGVIELEQVLGENGDLFDVRVTAIRGQLDVDTTTNWYRQQIRVQIDVRLVTTPEREFEFDSWSNWFDHGRIVSQGADRGRFISEYLEGRVADYERTATGFVVEQTVEPSAIPAHFRFARR